jgi:hypothetical protein
MRIRDWLRRHRPRPPEAKGSHYDLTAEEIEAVRAAFEARAAAIAIPRSNATGFGRETSGRQSPTTFDRQAGRSNTFPTPRTLSEPFGEGKVLDGSETPMRDATDPTTQLETADDDHRRGRRRQHSTR